MIHIRHSLYMDIDWTISSLLLTKDTMAVFYVLHTRCSNDIFLQRFFQESKKVVFRGRHKRQFYIRLKKVMMESWVEQSKSQFWRQSLAKRVVIYVVSQDQVWLFSLLRKVMCNNDHFCHFSISCTNGISLHITAHCS